MTENAQGPNPTPSLSQQRAIEAEPRALLVLAGPGAGKTFCLTERIRYLIAQCGFDPSRICAFTFTNKAAGEIAHRLSARLGEPASHITRGTLHAFCAELLRANAEHAGLTAGFDHRARRTSPPAVEEAAAGSRRSRIGSRGGRARAPQIAAVRDRA